MPKKNLHPEAVPTLIQERLRVWGQSIRTQRLTQRIRAADLCARMEISEATLRRLERGDAGTLWSKDAGQRVRLPSTGDDDGYF